MEIKPFFKRISNEHPCHSCKVANSCESASSNMHLHMHGWMCAFSLPALTGLQPGQDSLSPHEEKPATTIFSTVLDL